MAENLEHDQDSPDRPRKRLDRVLKVAQWRLPGGTRRARRSSDSGIPGWWYGDEEASQSFLEAAGAVIS